MKERIYFVKRGLSGDVGTVSQSESITQKHLSNPNERVKYEVHKGMVSAALFQDFSSAGHVLRGHVVATTIDLRCRPKYDPSHLKISAMIFKLITLKYIYQNIFHFYYYFTDLIAPIFFP